MDCHSQKDTVKNIRDNKVLIFYLDNYYYIIIFFIVFEMSMLIEQMNVLRYTTITNRNID